MTADVTLACHLYDHRGFFKASASISKPMDRSLMTFLPVFDRPVQLERNETYRIRIVIDKPAYFLLGIKPAFIF